MAEIDAENEVASKLTQPLLELERSEEDEGPIKEQTTESSFFSDEKKLPRRALFSGIFTGFFVHAVSLGAYAAMIVYSGEKGDKLPGFAMTSLSFLTQLDLMVYIMIWIAFTCTLTGSGMTMIRSRLGEHVKRRNVFVLGVYFLVGIVLGAFTAWSLVDSYLGFTVPLAPIAVTVLVDLILCYLMIWCYDVGNTQSATESTEEEVVETV